MVVTNMKRIGLTLAAAVVALLVMMPSSAQAAVSDYRGAGLSYTGITKQGTYGGISAWMRTPNYTRVASASFEPYGEHIYLRDSYTDGYYALANVAWRKKSGYSWNYRLYSTGSYRDINLSIPEGYSVKLRTCVGGSTWVSRCSGWYYGNA